jgi:hypothetical protein
MGATEGRYSSHGRPMSIFARQVRRTGRGWLGDPAVQPGGSNSLDLTCAGEAKGELLELLADHCVLGTGKSRSVRELLGVALGMAGLRWHGYM